MAGQPELRTLRAFVAVARELHFSRAADSLHLSQQALSSQIRQLEVSVGASLFDRSTRHVELTAAGRTLLNHAIPLLAAADRAWEDVAQIGSGEAGQVRMSYSPTVGRVMLPLMLEELKRKHPQIQIRSCEVWWDDQALNGGLVDIAIRRARPNVGTPNAASVPILQSPLGLILGRSHPLAQQEKVDVADLDGVALKLFPRAFSRSFYDTIVSSLRAAGFTGPVEELVIFGSGLLMHDAAACAEIAAGQAFGVGFDGQYRALEPELVWREVTPTVHIPMNLCWNTTASAAVRNTVGVVLDVARRMDWLPQAAHAQAEQLLLGVKP
jgi:DNA-binding transcriptional LysR family regulator